MDVLSAELTETVKKDRKLTIEEEMRSALKGGEDKPRPYVRRYLRNRKFSSVVHMADSTVPNEPDPPDPPVISYNIRLCCTSLPEPRWIRLEFWKLPKAILDIKQRIEKKHNIPVCVQSLYYEDKEIDDWRKILHLGIQDRASLELKYTSEADIEEVRVANRWFEFVKKLHKDTHTSIWTGSTAEVQFIVTAGLRNHLAENLSRNLLRPWDSSRACANRVFFNQLGGVRMVIGVYEQLSLEEWRGIPVILKMMETCCIQVLAAVAGSETIRSSIECMDGIGYMMRSFMRVKLQRGKVVMDTSGSPGCQEHNDLLVKEMLQACLDFLISFRERLNLHNDICSKSDIIDQILYIALSPSFSIEEAAAAMCVMACATQSTEVRKFMYRTSVLENIMEAIKVRMKIKETESKCLSLFRYYVQVILAFVVLTFSHHISQRLFEKVIIIMEDFVMSTPITDIVLAEKDTSWDIGWTLYKPFLKLLYPPPDPDHHKVVARYPKSDCKLIQKLQLLASESFLISIQVMIRHNPDKALSRLKDSKVIDYFLCLPQNVPSDLKGRAKDVVDDLRRETQSDPPVPKLINIVKASFAKNDFGLQKVMTMSTEDILMVLRPPAYPSHMSGRKYPPDYMHSEVEPMYVLKLE